MMAIMFLTVAESITPGRTDVRLRLECSCARSANLISGVSLDERRCRQVLSAAGASVVMKGETREPLHTGGGW